MNFELMAKLLKEKGDKRLSAEIIKRLNNQERHDLVLNIDCIDFLVEVRSELEKTVSHAEKEVIIHLIDKRINDIETVKYGTSGTLN
jgi:hypothetical protein